VRADIALEALPFVPRLDDPPLHRGAAVVQDREEARLHGARVRDPADVARHIVAVAPREPDLDAAVEQAELAEGLLRHHRADAVGADQQVGFPLAAVVEVGGDRIGRLVVVREALASMDQIRRRHRQHAFDRRRSQHAVVPAGEAGTRLGTWIERQPRAQPAAVVAELGDAVGAEVGDVDTHVAHHRQHRQ
jgi:hypothetical protein